MGSPDQVPNPTVHVFNGGAIKCKEKGFLSAPHWVTCLDENGNIVAGVEPHEIKRAFGKNYEKY